MARGERPPRRRRDAARASRTRRTRARGVRSAASTGRRSPGRRPAAAALAHRLRSAVSTQRSAVRCRVAVSRRHRRRPPVAPMPTPCSRCRCLPSVCSDGATISSARLNSAMSRYPQVAIDVLSAPIRLKVPSFSRAGPADDLLHRAVRRRHRPGCRAAASGGMSPCPSCSRGRAPRRPARAPDPSMTASAPQAIALAMSPPLRMPPSAITLT